MVAELYSVMLGDRVKVAAVPLEEAPVGPGHWAYPWDRSGPALYSVPDTDGGHEWVGWDTATQRGWRERSGCREYDGIELGSRFLVLYYPPDRRGRLAFWKLQEQRPMRLHHCRNRGEAEHVAERFMARRQHPFHWSGWPGVWQAWGWDARDIVLHDDCDDGCHCASPAPGEEFILIVEFEDEASAMRPDVRLEREAWLAQLDVDRALALAGCTEDGLCQPTCTHCAAPCEEIEAAWSWLDVHQREVRARERRTRRRVARSQELARC